MKKQNSRTHSISPHKKMHKKDSATSRDLLPLLKHFTGSVLQNRYAIGNQIGIGSFGQVYEITDLKKKDMPPLVVKFSSNLNLSEREIEAMKAIWDDANKQVKLDQNQ